MAEMQSHLRSNEEQLRKEQQRVIELQSQLRRNEQEINTLRQRLIETQRQETGRYFSDHQPEIPRDWVIKETEIQMTTEQLGRGSWGVAVFKGKFRGCDVAVKNILLKFVLLITGICLREKWTLPQNADTLVCCSLWEKLLVKGHC